MSSRSSLNCSGESECRLRCRSPGARGTTWVDGMSSVVGLLGVGLKILELWVVEDC